MDDLEKALDTNNIEGVTYNGVKVLTIEEKHARALKELSEFMPKDKCFKFINALAEDRLSNIKWEM